MRAELKDVLCPDIPDLAAYYPENPLCFGFLLQLLIGTQNVEGEESFQLTICTPQWLTENYAQDDVVIGRHFLIVFEYNHERILNRVRSYVNRCEGNTWAEVAQKLTRFAYWEFEDYKPGS